MEKQCSGSGSIPIKLPDIQQGRPIAEDLVLALLIRAASANASRFCLGTKSATPVPRRKGFVFRSCQRFADAEMTERGGKEAVLWVEISYRRGRESAAKPCDGETRGRLLKPWGRE